VGEDDDEGVREVSNMLSTVLVDGGEGETPWPFG
jgi:hypothetical protein